MVQIGIPMSRLFCQKELVVGGSPAPDRAKIQEELTEVTSGSRVVDWAAFQDGS
jgi:hypothetical protein